MQPEPTSVEPLALLRAARRCIEQGWTRRVLARTRGGRECAPTDPLACRWCAWGALDAGIGGSVPFRHPAAQALLQAAGDATVGAFNDDARSKREVLDLFDRAIAALEMEQAA